MMQPSQLTRDKLARDDSFSVARTHAPVAAPTRALSESSSLSPSSSSSSSLMPGFHHSVAVLPLPFPYTVAVAAAVAYIFLPFTAVTERNYSLAT